MRFISEKYYDKSYELGGLEENSIWRHNQEYKALLQSAMENRMSLVYEEKVISVAGVTYTVKKPGSISRNNTYQVWKFTNEDIQKVKDFVELHGLGNYKESNALDLFIQEFGDCRVE